MQYEPAGSAERVIAYVEGDKQLAYYAIELARSDNARRAPCSYSLMRGVYPATRPGDPHDHTRSPHHRRRHRHW